MASDNSRDIGGRIVREAWVRWAMTQPNPKPSWLVPYDELSEPDKEADRQIFEACIGSETEWGSVDSAPWGQVVRLRCSAPAWGGKSEKRVFAATRDMHQEKPRWLIANSGADFVQLSSLWIPTHWSPLWWPA